MGLTTIGIQKTPGRPIQITFAPTQGLPNANQQLVLLGHMAATGTGASGSMSATGAYIPYVVNNVGSVAAASGEVGPLFGAASELAKMIVAAVAANAGGSTFPPITVIPLKSTDTAFGSAFNALNRIEAEWVASPYDGVTSYANAQTLLAQMQAMSGPQNVENSQFGSVGVVASFTTAAASTLPNLDTGAQSGWMVAVWKRDSAPARTVGELCAAAAASLAANAVPFNPVDNIAIAGEPAQAAVTDYIQIGAGAESEVALNLGWSPLRTQANGVMSWVRSVSTRLTIDGTTPISSDAYVDVQDFQVLVFWRKTLWTRLNQPDMKQVKASLTVAQNMLGEVIRLANVFQDQGMFQAVQQLASQFILQRNVSDRSRFDLLTPVNVIPGLHVVATNVSAGTQFDTFTI